MKCTKTRNCTYRPVDDYTQSTINFLDFIVRVPSVALLLAIGLVLNTLVIVVIIQCKRSSANIMLMVLAVFDTLYLLSLSAQQLPWEIHHYLYPMYGMLDWRNKHIKVLHGVMFASKSTTLYILVLMSLERYIVLMWPIKSRDWCTKQKTVTAICVIIVGSFLFSYHRFMRYELYTYCYLCTGQYRPGFKWIRKFDNTFLVMTAAVLDRNLIRFDIPFSTVLVLNTCNID